MEMFLLVTHIVIVVTMVLVILIQKSSTDSLSGLSGASSNPGAMMNVRGSANILTRMTSILAIGFMCTSLLLAVSATKASKSEVLDGLEAKPAAAVPAAANPAAPVKVKPQVPVAE